MRNERKDGKTCETIQETEKKKKIKSIEFWLELFDNNGCILHVCQLITEAYSKTMLNTKLKSNMYTYSFIYCATIVFFLSVIVVNNSNCGCDRFSLHFFLRSFVQELYANVFALHLISFNHTWCLCSK